MTQLKVVLSRSYKMFQDYLYIRDMTDCNVTMYPKTYFFILARRSGFTSPNDLRQRWIQIT